MKYNVWLLKENGLPSLSPSVISANGIVHAQNIALSMLRELNEKNCLIGWSIQTVTEIPL